MINSTGMTAIGRQAGFTLIEIAIVLVIVGLLIGGVLQGQQLIENSRVRAAVNNINGIATAMYSYRDRYGRWPGDDGPAAAISGRGGPWSVLTANGGNNDGFIATSTSGYTFSPQVNTEGQFFWQHLRAAGFLTGDPSVTGVSLVPTNPFGGLFGVMTAELYQTAGAGTGLQGIKACLSQLPGAAAAAIDRQLDDGEPDSGRVRANSGTGNVAPATTTPATSYDDSLFYTSCTVI